MPRLEKVVLSEVRGLATEGRSSRLGEITEKAYDLLELALDRAYSKLQQGEIDFSAKDLVSLLQLLKQEGPRRV